VFAGKVRVQHRCPEIRVADRFLDVYGVLTCREPSSHSSMPQIVLAKSSLQPRAPCRPLGTVTHRLDASSSDCIPMPPEGGGRPRATGDPREPVGGEASSGQPALPTLGAMPAKPTRDPEECALQVYVFPAKPQCFALASSAGFA
jgi:hypothetical protein